MKFTFYGDARIITIISFVHISDPEHQRAKGNVKYFEFQLEKQKKAAEEKPQEQEERGKRDTTEKKKKNSKESLSLIPERKKYEMLCRGEGLRMVRKKSTRNN